MIARAALVSLMLVAAALYGARAGSAQMRVERLPLHALPLGLAEWAGRDAAPLADDIVNQLGVDDYINRVYQRSAGPPVGVYVGYYDSQRHGDTIHSPQNCLPGAGWRAVASRRATLDVDGGVEVNHYVIQKGLDRQVVLYWYQGRGRVVAGEYRNKALLMLDAARLGRTDGGLVRLISPVLTTADAAGEELAAFAGALFPHLPSHIP